MRFARLRWLTPQKRTPRYLSGRVMHVVLRVDASPVRPLLGRATFFVGHVAAYGLIRFSFVSFSSSFLRLHLVALFFSFPLIDIAIRLLALPLFSTSRLLSRIDYHSFSAFNLDTELFTYDATRSVTGGTLTLTFSLFSFPASTYSLCVAYTVSTTRTRCINTSSPALPKGRQPWPPFLSPFVCVRFPGTVAHSPSCLLSTVCSLSLAVRCRAITTRQAVCEPVCSTPLVS